MTVGSPRWDRRGGYIAYPIDTSKIGPVCHNPQAKRPVRVRYINWRGEEAIRQIIPIALTWGSTEWHPEPQWLLEAHDVGKGEKRLFALSCCDFMPDVPA